MRFRFENKDTGTRIIIGAVVATVIVLFLLPIKVPYAVTVPGKILCTQEWIVTLNADGGIVAFVVDRASGVTKHYSLAQFERGDAVQFTLDPHVVGGITVAQGDTIGVVQSSEIERELQRLRGELRNVTASLAVSVTGEKQSIVEEAKQSVEYAKRQAEDLKAVLARQKLLYEKGLVAQQEYDLAERRASTSVIEVSIAEAKLRSATTGAKKEETEFVRAQIRSLQNEIDVVEKQEQAYRLISPLSGVVTQVAASDTLLIVSDTTEYVVIMPVPLRERSHVLPRQNVKLYASEVERIPSAVMMTVDNTIQSLNGQQVILATAQLNHATGELLNGLLARCSIECASLSPFDYLGRKFHTLLR